MNGQHGEAAFLPMALALLGAAVASVPVARALGFSAIVAYLVAGTIIGPFGFQIFSTPEQVLPVAELGIVMLMFVIGLELEIDRLLAMRRDILGLGAAQLVVTSAVIFGLAYMVGVNARGAVVIGLALALSATAIALQILEERGQVQQTYAQRAIAILLFQDIAIVPLLALLPLLAPGADTHTGTWTETLMPVAWVAGAIVAIVLVGRYLLNPFFRGLADTGSREVMTAAALLVVLGAALLMQAAGMSMALGAFLAGLLLAESNFRHELEADIEPFRGLLLALFFMSVGMGIDLSVVRANVVLIIAAALVITALKAGIVYVLFGPTCGRRADAIRAGSVLTAAGEFAFVLFPLGASLGILSAKEASLYAAVAAITMLIGPLTATLTEQLLRLRPKTEQEADDFSDASGSVLVIGFGRFGQVVSQCLLTQGVDVTAIDDDSEMIDAAGRFGFKVYFGDGTRLDVLRAAGAERVQMIAVCVDNRETASRIVDVVNEQFPDTKLYVRSYDRAHTLELIAKGVNFELRETFESALAFGRSALEGLGVDSERAQAIEEDVRRRDLERLALQQAGGLLAGVDKLLNKPQPEPLVVPGRRARGINPEAETIIREAESKKAEAGGAITAPPP
jgi:monovalent cation:proton antiporter-2 (CPA2) family protein